MSRLSEATSDEVSQLPVDQVGVLVLEHMIDDDAWHVYNFLGLLTQLDTQAKYAVSEGINWLMTMGLLAHFRPDQGDAGSIFVTRLGRQAHEGGLPVALAAPPSGS